MMKNDPYKIDFLIIRDPIDLQSHLLQAQHNLSRPNFTAIPFINYYFNRKRLWDKIITYTIL
jgi:hypothetical protein